ncbi:MAG: NYN domain-containing protein [Kiritimatiellales bacterium]
MTTEPSAKRVMAFFDGQNLFYAAKDAFGYPFPNYDPHKLATEICKTKGWNLSGIRFYTGIPDIIADPDRHHFWSAKLAVMGTRGIKPFTRTLRYQNKVISLPNGQLTTAQVGREKGIDVRIALDIVRFALENRYDVALIFSQDQDLSEAVDDVLSIARRDNRWIKVACAFPISPTYQNTRGINKTDWIKIDRATYDTCIDPNDYRRKNK